MHAVAREGVQHHGGHGGEGLPLTGAHLRDLALVQHHGADQLHVVWAHAQAAPRGLAHQREGLVEHLVNLGAIGQARADVDGTLTNGVVGEILHRGLERVDAHNARHSLLHAAPLAEAKDLVQDLGTHAGVSDGPCAGSACGVPAPRIGPDGTNRTCTYRCIPVACAPVRASRSAHVPSSVADDCARPRAVR